MKIRYALLTSALLTVFAGAANAQFISGFESPNYSAGALEGQNGWALTAGNAGSGMVSDSATIAALLDSKGFRSDNPTGSGNHALVYSAPETGGATSYYRHQVGGFDETSVVIVDWRMRSLGPSTNATGTWLILDEYNNNNSRAAAVRMVRSSETTHTIDFYSGGWQTTSIAASYDDWFDLRIIADYNTKIYQLFVNGSEVTGGGVSFYHTSSAAATGISLFRGGPDTGAIFDDISVQTVPEPATLAALGAGALALLRRKKKSA